jgi:hypothetical protein
MIARLENNKATFLQRQANDGELYQLFITGPNGMRVELNFDSEEAERHGIKPEMTALEAISD